MRAPEFWSERGWTARALMPIGGLYALGGRLRRQWTRPWRAPVPVVCVGNLVIGGAGKTPVAIALAAMLQGEGVHIVSRGYGGRLPGPIRVDPSKQLAAEVGDEPLLLAKAAPTWVAKDKRDGVEAAVAAGAKAVLLDDGLQNPSLVHDLALVVVDGGYGFGNGLVMPAGPLREPIADGLGRASAVVLVGPDRTQIRARLGSTPVVEAHLVPDGRAARFKGRRVVAFAGIGRPRKFFDTLAELGAELVERHSFADHHPFAEDEIMRLVETAHRLDAVPVTTEKDWVRLPREARLMVEVARVELVWCQPERIRGLVERAFARV